MVSGQNDRTIFCYPKALDPFSRGPSLFYTLRILSLTFKRQGEEEEKGGSRKHCCPPFSPKSPDFPKTPNTDQIWVLPPCSLSQQDCATCSGNSPPAQSRRAEHLSPAGRLGSRSPQIEGAAILGIEASFPRPQPGFEEGVYRKNKREREKREGKREENQTRTRERR